MSSDQVQLTRAHHAQALRRLADAAQQAALLEDFTDSMPDDRDRAYRIVLERTEGVKHAHAIHAAARAGAAAQPPVALCPVATG